MSLFEIQKPLQTIEEKIKQRAERLLKINGIKK